MNLYHGETYFAADHRQAGFISANPARPCVPRGDLSTVVLAGINAPAFQRLGAARETRQTSFSSADAGALRMAGFSPSNFGRLRLSICAVCTSPTAGKSASTPAR